MEKEESATASIGIKIHIRDLLFQLCETNEDIIKSMLFDGFIEDENGELNQIFHTIVHKRIHLDWMKLKDYLFQKFNQSDINLIDSVLLIPIKQIATTSRWGYEREGINSISRDLNFHLSLTDHMYKDIEHTEIVFILCQNSG